MTAWVPWGFDEKPSAETATRRTSVSESRQAPIKTDDELDQLAQLGDCRPNSRLACQMPMSDKLDGLRVRLAPNSMT